MKTGVKGMGWYRPEAQSSRRSRNWRTLPGPREFRHGTLVIPSGSQSLKARICRRSSVGLLKGGAPPHWVAIHTVGVAWRGPHWAALNAWRLKWMAEHRIYATLPHRHGRHISDPNRAWNFQRERAGTIRRAFSCGLRFECPRSRVSRSTSLPASRPEKNGPAEAEAIQ